jgi:hypothetical protein
VPRATLHNGSRVQVGHTTLVVRIVEEGGGV